MNKNISIKKFCTCKNKNPRAPRCKHCGFSTTNPSKLNKKQQWKMFSKRELEKERLRFFVKYLEEKEELEKKIKEAENNLIEIQERIAWETRRREKRTYTKQENYRFDSWRLYSVKDIEEEMYKLNLKKSRIPLYPYMDTRYGKRFILPYLERIKALTK